MGQYKLYYLNHAGKIFSARDVICVEDMDAIDMATGLLNGHDIEVWQGARRVAHVKLSERSALSQRPSDVTKNLSLDMRLVA